MKNKFYIFLLVTLLFSIEVVSCACGCKHDWQEATCEEPKACTLCGRQSGEPLGHDWQEATASQPKTCSRCGKTEGVPLSAWKIDYFVDDFGDYTKDSYIKGIFYGYFSDSATSNSVLKVMVSIKDYGGFPYVGFRLFKYGTKAQSFSKSDSVSMKVKENDGTTASYSLIGSGDLALYTSYESFRSVLLSNESLSCVIVEKNTYIANSEYHFTITTNGLRELLEA